jgi:hypothetical protein
VSGFVRIIRIGSLDIAPPKECQLRVRDGAFGGYCDICGDTISYGEQYVEDDAEQYCVACVDWEE